MDCVALDLPPVYTRPSTQTLISLLRSLTLRVSSFQKDEGATESGGNDGYRGLLSDSVGLTSYLTSIIKSPLAWIEDEEAREQIWSLASMRLSERAGRTAMHSISRKFTIPRFSISSGSRLESDTPLDITLLEPSLTGDNLGHKTWCASYLLSMRLQDLRSFLKASGSKAGVRVLELGGGTGLLGLAFGSLFPNTAIDLTDLPGIVPNLADNVAANRHLLEQVGSSASVFALDWAHAVAKQDDERYHIVLAADPIYSPSHPALLANAVGLNLLRTAEARLVIGLPTRDAYTPEVEDLRSRLDAMGLLLVKDGEEVGVDDWEGHGGRRTEVRCWWGVWKWQLV